ncbi:unnamed protein product [Arctogadus glacialis]
MSVNEVQSDVYSLHRGGPSTGPCRPPSQHQLLPIPRSAGAPPSPSLTPGVSESGGEGSKVVLSTATAGISQKFPGCAFGALWLRRMSHAHDLKVR